MMPVPWMTMALRGVSAIAFAWYGGTLLGKQTMVPEFESYGMARFRTLTGVLQLAGSAGLVLGYPFAASSRSEHGLVWWAKKPCALTRAS